MRTIGRMRNYFPLKFFPYRAVLGTKGNQLTVTFLKLAVFSLCSHDDAPPPTPPGTFPLPMLKLEFAEEHFRI